MKRPAGAPRAEASNHGGGGPCRAYLHHLCHEHGKPFSWILSNLEWSADYAKVKKEAGPFWKRLVEIGQRGTEVKRFGGKKVFKPLPRSCQSQAEAGEPVDMTCPDEVWQLAIRINDDRLQEHIRDADRNIRSNLNASKRQQQDANQQLVAWSDGSAQDNPLAHSGLRPMPGPVSVRLLRWVWPIHDVVTHIAQRLPTPQFAQLRKYWTELHQMYMCEKAPSIPSAKVAAATAPEASFKLKLCCVARMCLCDQRPLEFLVDRLKHLLRQDLAAESLMRKWCVKGYLLLGIHSLTAPPMLLHLAAINLLSFNAVTWRLMPEQEYPPEEGRHLLASVDFSREHLGFETWWRQLAALDLSHAYTMTWWTLVFNDSALDIWAPGRNVEFQRVRAVPPREMWHGSKRQRTRRHDHPVDAVQPNGPHVEHADPEMQAIHALIGPPQDQGEVSDPLPPEAPDEAEASEEGGDEGGGDDDDLPDFDDASDAGQVEGGDAENHPQAQPRAAKPRAAQADWDKLYCADRLGLIRLSYSLDSWQVRGACLQSEHGSCSWTRTCTAWRPVGAAWAYASFRCTTKAEHHAFRDRMMREPGVRRRARQELQSLHPDGFDTFAACERDFVSLGPMHEDE